MKDPDGNPSSPPLELVPRPDRMIVEYWRLRKVRYANATRDEWEYESFECHRIEACSDEGGTLHVEFYRKNEEAPFECFMEPAGRWHSLRLSEA